MQSSAKTTKAELFAVLDDMPDSKMGNRRAVFTPEEDEALLAYWPVKRKTDVAKAVGHCINACRDRYNELVEE